MPDLVMAAMSSLIPRLGELLKEEYKLQTGMKERISSLTKELEVAQAALCKVAQVPWDQLDKQDQIWAREVREASYDMEDVLDTFLVRVKGLDSAEQEESMLKPLKEMINFFKKCKARRKISGDVKDIMSHLQEVTERYRRYKVADIVAMPVATTSTVDPRLAAMYTQLNKLVGLDKSTGELMSKLQLDDLSNTKMKIVSIVGIGGLGKTTLARVVYDNLRGNFDCSVFVSVGRNPDLQKVLQMLLVAVDKTAPVYVFQDIDQLIKNLRGFLRGNKRYFIVIDDLWEKKSWEIIKLAIIIDDDNDSRGRIIITTRILEVAKKADEVYELPPLPYDRSRKLLYTRIYGDERKYVIGNEPDKISDEILRKCGGIPLAIITMASLLVGKPKDQWSQINKSIGFGCQDNEEAENTMRILSFSYYDLPTQLRTCLLYLSAFPEDSVIYKDSLVWRWVAEGFIHKEEGIRLFETGEGYFNDLINRSMIQAVESKYDDNIIIGCRVHDMILDFIQSRSQEETFFTVLDNNVTQDTLQQSNVRWLASHHRTIGQPHQTNHFEMLKKLRSFIALECVIETWAPLSSFRLLRVLAIENCRATDYSCVPVEHLGRLLQLRFLSLRGTKIGRVPEEIGALRLLQTLDLLRSDISELPWSGSLPKQLVCLSITLDPPPQSPLNFNPLEFGIRPTRPKGDAFDGKKFSVEGMTSLEELTIDVSYWRTVEWLVDGLGCLRELRVLNIFYISWDEEDQRDFVESLGHLDKLQKLTISGRMIQWQATDLVLSHDFQHLAINSIYFSRLPSGINPSRLPNLSHLHLWLRHLDEENLKILGLLPDLHYLSLNLVLLSPATIRNISDSDACYFPKLWCFKLTGSIFSFIVNKDDKRVSFHIWNGLDISMPSVSVSDYELQRARSSVSNGQNKDSTICSSKGAAAAPRFMPSLQVLHLEVGHLFDNISNWAYNFGWEHLSSLQEINVDLYLRGGFENIVETELRRAAEVHPNHPTLNVKRCGSNVKRN